MNYLLRLSAVASLMGMMSMPAMSQNFHVSPRGSDTWSGRIATPTPDGKDGPFRTLARVQTAVRAAGQGMRRTVTLGEGTYFLEAPLALTDADSGTADRPVVFRAREGERVVLSGGRRINGWSRRGALWVAPIPEAKNGTWDFRQLRVGDKAQTLARHPDLDPADPVKKGWLFARNPAAAEGGFGTSMSNIHTPGDTIEWEINAPVTGQYSFWMRYGQLMKPHGRTDMDGQTAMQVDGGGDIPLVNLPDTGGWSTFRWSNVATLPLSVGRHLLRWTNRKGGGINMDALAICSDPAWKPVGEDLAPPAKGASMQLIQAECYKAAKGKEMKISTARGKGCKDKIPYREGDVPEDMDVVGGQVQLFPAWSWVGGPVQLGGVDREKRQLLLAGKNAQQDIRPGNRYYIQNVRGALTSPGEFFLDKQAGELLYIPKTADFAGQKVVAPRLDRLVEIRGDADADTWAEHIRFEGIEFRDTRYSTEVGSLYCPNDAALWLDRARHISVVDCTFRLLGGYAVRLENQANACRVLGCRIEEMGQGGIIACGDTHVDQPRDVVVAGCTMRDLGRVYKHVAGVYVTTGSAFRVAHNDIHDVPRYAISFKSYNKDRYSHDNIAEFNDIRRTNLETNDTGGIETLGRDRTLSGNIIRYNLILDTVGLKHTSDGGIVSPFYTWGIYLDDYSSGTRVVGNIVARNYRGGYHNHLGFDNVVENNVFVDGQQYQAEWNGSKDMRRNTFTNNIVCYANPEATYIRSSGWNPGVLSACDRNVLWCTDGDPRDNTSLTPAGDWNAWRALGFDVRSVVADPLFVDAANDDYRLKPGSPALKLGFKPIPVERIGVRGYEAKAFDIER